MDRRILSLEMRALCKSVDRYLGETMPESAASATGGNAHIILFLVRNRDREIYQHTIEQHFGVTRSTVSRVLALMEKKGLITREPVAHDARLKKIVPTAKADAIVADLKANGERTERLLLSGFSDEEEAALREYVQRMRDNIARAQQEFESSGAVADGIVADVEAKNDPTKNNTADAVDTADTVKKEEGK